MPDDLELGAGKSCFVISPIGNRLAPIGTEPHTIYETNIQMWERVIEPACNAFGLVAVRSDKISEPGDIPEQIFTLLRDADVVIADLTGGNPNVMYELGLRHSQNKITIQIGEYARLPFDVQTIRTNQFTRTEAGLIDARTGLMDSLRVGLSGKFTPVAATRVWLNAEPASPVDIAESASKSTEEQEDDEGPGIIEVGVDTEIGLARIAEELAAVTEIFNEIGPVVQDYPVEMAAIDAKGGNMAARLAATKRLADRLTPVTDRFDERTSDYETALLQVDAGFSYLLTLAEEDPARRAEATGFLTSLVELTDAAESVEPTMVQILEVTRTMSQASRLLRPSASALARGTSRFIKGNGVMRQWRSRAKALLGAS